MKKIMSIWYKFVNLFEHSEHGNLSIKHLKDNNLWERKKAVWVGVKMNEGDDKNGKRYKKMFPSFPNLRMSDDKMVIMENRMSFYNLSGYQVNIKY